MQIGNYKRNYMEEKGIIKYIIEEHAPDLKKDLSNHIRQTHDKI